MKRSIILKLQGLVAVLLLALALAACGSNTTPTTAPTATSQPTTASGSATTAATSATTVAPTAAAATPTAAASASGDASLKVDLLIADGVLQNESQLLKSQLEAFKKLYPNVRVTSTHYNPEELGDLVKAAAGTASAPALVIAPADYTADFSATKAIQPADKALDPAFLKNYAPNALGASQLNGVQWGVPYTYGNVAVMLYNKKLVPAPPATTDDMVSIAQKLSANTKNEPAKEREFGLALDLNQPTWFVAWLGGFGGSVLDSNNQPTLNTPEMVKTLQFYQQLAYTDKVATPQYEFGDNQTEYAFRDGRLGMLIAGDWNIPSYGGAQPKKAKNANPAPSPSVAPTGQASIEVTPGANDYADKFELAVAPLPKVAATGKYPAPLINNKTIFFGAQLKGDQLKAAQAFVQFLASSEQQQAMAGKGLVPTTQAALNSEAVKGNPILSGLADQLAIAKPQPAAIEMRAIWDAILPNLQAITADTMKPQDAARKMQEMALENIKALKSS